MATCTKTWTRKTFKYGCTLDADHDGPNHLDEEHNDAYIDGALPLPEPEVIPEPVDPRAWM